MKKVLVSAIVIASVFAWNQAMANASLETSYNPTIKDKVLLEKIELGLEKMSNARLWEIDERIENILDKLERNSRLEYLIYAIHDDVNSLLEGSSSEESVINSIIWDNTTSKVDLDEDEMDEDDKNEEDDKDEELSVSDIPTKALDYISANYGNLEIVSAERDEEELDVELSDGTELEFTLDGTFIQVDSDEDENDDEDDDEDED